MQFTVANRFLLLAALAGVAAAVSGCGSSVVPHDGSTAPVSASTSVTLLGSSTANDQLSGFGMQLTSLTLTNAAGTTVTAFSVAQGEPYPDFLHLNGTAEPLTTFTMPQDTYTSATATVGAAFFNCELRNTAAGVDDSDNLAYGQTPSAQVTVDLSTPVTIQGAAMGLMLNLLVTPSATANGCTTNPGIQTYSINPTFTLTAVPFAAQPTNAANGRFTGLSGLVTAVNAQANSFSVTASSGAVWSLTSNSSTSYQGVSGYSTLGVGMPVDLDANAQTDGSLLATRVAVLTPDPTNLTLVNGPLIYVTNQTQVADILGREGVGFLFPDSSIYGTQIPGMNLQLFSYGDAAFGISGEATNLQTLPFSPVFSPDSMVPGQNVSITTHAQAMQGAPLYEPAATITLKPQTIDGTITAISAAGGFTTYTVSLAADDTFPLFAVQPDQTNVLSDPSTVQVFVDSNVQRLNTTAPTIGTTLRFRGLVFDDAGVLKMDCLQLNDGVPD